MEHATFDTPISFHVFNRPHLTQKTFEVIKSLQPKVLFVTADCPRPDHPDDVEKCANTRRIIEQNIDWQCDLYRNFSEINKGSYKSTSEGLSWVFDHVDEAIILEDDCLPHKSFFRFCRELLERYREDDRIALISGNNFLPDMKGYDHSYYFSRYTHMWGWATWKRTWDMVDLEMKDWLEFRKNMGLKNIFQKKVQINYWDKIFDSMSNAQSKQHWDYKLLLYSFMNNTLTILPRVNLVSNIGAGADGTNNKKSTLQNNIPAKNIDFPLKHPDFILKLWWADEYTESKIFSGRIGKIKKRLSKFLPFWAKALIRRLFASL